MKILADESVDFSVVKALRQKGFDVKYIAENSLGITNEEVFESANKTDRMLLTADKNFGELVYRLKRNKQRCCFLSS